MIVDPFPNASDDDGNMTIFVDRFLRLATLSGTHFEVRNSADKAVGHAHAYFAFLSAGSSEGRKTVYEESLILMALRKRVFARNSSIREDAGDLFRTL